MLSLLRYLIGCWHSFGMWELKEHGVMMRRCSKCGFYQFKMIK
jgi:Zn ribbon nucleic-acid-binding protein